MDNPDLTPTVPAGALSSLLDDVRTGAGGVLQQLRDWAGGQQAYQQKMGNALAGRGPMPTAEETNAYVPPAVAGATSPLYELGLSPLISLAESALPGKRAVTAQDVAAVLDPAKGQKAVNVGGLNLQVHPEEWRFLGGPTLMDTLTGLGGGSKEDVLNFLRNGTTNGNVRPVVTEPKPQYEDYTLAGPRDNYRVRGLNLAGQPSGDLNYHFGPASSVHLRLTDRPMFDPNQPNMPLTRTPEDNQRVADLVARAINPDTSHLELVRTLTRERTPGQLDIMAQHVLSSPGRFPNTPQSVFADLQDHLDRMNLVNEAPTNTPRFTHLDELQSDFYSEPKYAADHAEKVRDAQQRVADAEKEMNAQQEKLLSMRDNLLNNHHELTGWGTNPHPLVQDWRKQALRFDSAYEIYNNARDELDKLNNAPGRRLPGSFEKLWPRIGFNQAAREALENGHDALTWTPPQEHAELYELPYARDLSPGNPARVVSLNPDLPPLLMHNYDTVPATQYRGPVDVRKLEPGDTVPQGRLFLSPHSLMYHNMYGPGGVVEDAARRFARAYGEDPKALLIQQSLEGMSVPTDVPGLRITPKMRDIYRRLQDQGKPGVPLYARGGSVQTPNETSLADSLGQHLEAAST